jgi:serine/threonine protein kinase
VREEIRNKQIKLEGKVWDAISKDAKGFVLMLLQRNPEDRPTAKEALRHKFIQNRSKLSKKPPDPEITGNIPGSMMQYGECSDFKKTALQIIASRSSSDEIFELRQLFNEYDKSCDGSLSFSEFTDCLSQMNYTDAELKSMFAGVVRVTRMQIKFSILLWRKDCLPSFFVSPPGH